MFSVGFEMDIIKRWGRWVSATFHQYLWRDEHILSNISRGILRDNPKNDGDSCLPPPRMEGGKRPNNQDRRRLVLISKAMSGALRRRHLP